jgi:hypothetical protein
VRSSNPTQLSSVGILISRYFHTFEKLRIKKTKFFLLSFLSVETFLGSAFYQLNADFSLGFLLIPEDRGDVFLRSIDWLSLDHVALYSRRHSSS